MAFNDLSLNDRARAIQVNVNKIQCGFAHI